MNPFKEYVKKYIRTSHIRTLLTYIHKYIHTYIHTAHPYITYIHTYSTYCAYLQYICKIKTFFPFQYSQPNPTQLYAIL